MPGGGRGFSLFHPGLLVSESTPVSYTHLDVYKRQPLGMEERTEKKKNRSTKEKVSLPNLKCSGFVPMFAESSVYYLRTKRSAAVFLMSVRLVKGLLRG